MTDKVLGGQTTELILGNREGDDRNILGLDTGVGQLAEEGDIGVTIQSGNHRSVARSAELLDLGHDLLVIGMTEGSIFLDDRSLRDTLGRQILLQHEIRGPGIDVVGANEVELLLSKFVQQIIDARSGLLADGLGGVEMFLDSSSPSYCTG